MQLFHYHLLASNVRAVEARYIGKLGFRLVARYGRIGDDQTSYEAGVSWDELDRLGFKLRLSELERGAVNVVVQPGQFEIPRVDHLGFALDEREFHEALGRAADRNLPVQDHPGRRTFVATKVGYRIELHPPREWVEEVLAAAGELRVGELHLRADEPEAKAAVLAQLLDAPTHAADAAAAVDVGESVVRFLPQGPKGRPELDAELLL